MKPALHRFADLFQPVTRGRWDWLSPLVLVALGTLGVLFIYSAQLAGPRQNWTAQVMWLMAGTALYMVVALVDYRVWLGMAHWCYLAAVVPLGLVLLPGLGHASGGSQRWLDLGVTRFQPAETAKFGVLLLTASLLVSAKFADSRDACRTLGKLALAAGGPIFLILLQPDLKSAIVLPPMIFSMLYVSRLPTRYFTWALVAVLLAGAVVVGDAARYKNFVLAQAVPGEAPAFKHADPNWSGSWVPLRDYQRNRLVAFLWPELVSPMGDGWNQSQSLLAVGSGGLAGKGWTEGPQTQLGYLPRTVAHNDFIFSVIAEEMGFLGSILVLGLFGLVLFNGIRIAGLARDRFGALLAVGVTAIFAVHMFVNIAMTVGLVPITGIPLPFVSYGGSFVLSCCLLQGLVQSVYRFRKDFP